MDMKHKNILLLAVALLCFAACQKQMNYAEYNIYDNPPNGNSW